MSDKLANEFTLYHYLDLPDAHKQGFDAGFDADGVPYNDPINAYQREYNRGLQAGKFFRQA